MADEAFLCELGLGRDIMDESMGATANANLGRILAAASPSRCDKNTTTATRIKIALAIRSWSGSTGYDNSALEEHLGTIYSLVGELATTPDEPDIVKEDADYKGNASAAVEIAEGIKYAASVAGTKDPTHALMHKATPLAFDTLEAILDWPELELGERITFRRHETVVNVRTELCTVLLRTMSHVPDVRLPNAFACITKVLLWKKISAGGDITKLKRDANSAMDLLGMADKTALAHAGPQLMELIKAGGNDQLISKFSSPDIYNNHPEVVRDNLDIFLRQNYRTISYFFNTIAAKDPAALVPHAQFFVDKLSQEPLMAGITLMVLEQLAKKDPVLLYPHVATILGLSKSFPANTSGQVGSFIAAVAAASTEAADESFVRLVDLLECCEPVMRVTVLSNISNVMRLLSSKDVLMHLMPRITEFKSVHEAIFTNISDFSAGRSLETLTNRVDVLDAKINALNSKVSETCTNLSDVIAYVDANMADMKDFLAEVVKKLPKPKRLEVVGTLRKTLVLHFECVHSGYEYGVTSTEWSKWLKMGFSLVKAGQAIIDIGMGNPLGILKKGVECVQEIYSAYKNEDDDEFNTYITNPFLTSAEQDQLLDKLRGQGFFDIFDYDNQLAGWFMKTPEKHGKPPGGEAGSVTKVWKKEGDSMINTEALKAFANDYIQNEMVNTSAGYTATAIGVAEAGEAAAKHIKHSGGSADAKTPGASTGSPTSINDSESSDTHSPLHKGGSSVSCLAPTKGNRAAALREEFGVASVALADDKLAQASLAAEHQQKIAELEAKFAGLQSQFSELSRSFEELRNRKQCCSCVIC
jgi:hypothetical protein